MSGDRAKVRIVSDGTDAGTRVLVDDKALDGVARASWQIGAGELATAVVELLDVEVDATGEQVSDAEQGEALARPPKVEIHFHVDGAFSSSPEEFAAKVRQVLESQRWRLR